MGLNTPPLKESQDKKYDKKQTSAVAKAREQVKDKVHKTLSKWLFIKSLHEDSRIHVGFFYPKGIIMKITITLIFTAFLTTSLFSDVVKKDSEKTKEELIAEFLKLDKESKELEELEKVVDKLHNTVNNLGKTLKIEKE